MRDVEWLVPVSGIVLIELLLWCVAYLAGAAQYPMLAPYWTVLTIVFGFVVVARLVWLIVGMAIQGVENPTRQLIGDLRANWLRAVIVIAGIHLIALGSSAFAALKGAIPKVVPFWLDMPLADLEEFGGVAPWQVTHWLLGYATSGVDRWYATFVPVHILSVFAVLLTKPSQQKTQAIITLSLAWMTIGILGAYLLSSAGPIFYDRIYGSDRFQDLVAAVHAHAPMTVKTADFLWRSYATDQPGLFNGISAMPSMHVALSLWLALVLGGTRASILGWLNYAVILVASVHLGWHYLSDGIVGSLMMLCLWRMAPGLAFRRRTAAPHDEPQVVPL